jgi:hypothetical protein
LTPAFFSRRIFLATTVSAIAAAKTAQRANKVPVRLDHILLGSNDLDHGIEFVLRYAGVRAEFGGVHPGRGTRNALLSLGDTHYLEIIAPDPAQPQAQGLGSLSSLTEPRIVGWAAHPGDLDAFATRIRKEGLAAAGPQPGSRKRPDGRTLDWKTLQLKDDHAGLLPFFIEWGIATLHPSADAPAGAKLTDFELASPDVVDVERLCSLLDLDVAVRHADRPQLRAQISGPRGQTMTLTS